MMRQIQQYLKTLAFILILSGFVVSYQFIRESSYNIAASTSTSNTFQDELKAAQDNLVKSLNRFNKELREVANNQRQKNNIDNQTVLKSLQQLQEANQNLQNNLLSSEQKQTAPQLQKIDTIINNIQTIAKRLKPGLEESDVVFIQKFLKLDVNNPNVRKNLGKFGLVTQSTIQKYFQKNTDNLEPIINKLSFSNPVNESSQINQTSNLTIEELTSENQRLKKDVTIYPILSFFIGLVIGSLLMFIYRDFYRESRSTKHRQATGINTALQQTLVENQNINQNTNQNLNQVIPPSKQTQVTSSDILQQNTSNNFIQPKNRTQIPQTDLITAYNHNPNSLLNSAIEVSETKDSINQRRLGAKNAVILEQVRRGRGNYWIVTKEGKEYLVPKGNFKIDEYNYETVQALFDCQNYQPRHSRDFKLIQPAQVTTVAQKMWQIIEKGILQF